MVQSAGSDSEEDASKAGAGPAEALRRAQAQRARHVRGGRCSQQPSPETSPELPAQQPGQAEWRWVCLPAWRGLDYIYRLG
jgi:hypothetical protein